MSSNPNPVLGPMAKAAMALPAGGYKRRKVLTLIGAYADAGVSDPSITEITARMKVPRIAVVQLVDGLERDGLLEIDRQQPGRNRYTIAGVAP